jgi:hypothetical protein
MFFYFLGCPKKQSRLQVDEILILKIFLDNGHLKYTYALSSSKVKIIIYQSFNVKIFLNTIPPVNFKNTFHLLKYIKVFQTLYITYYELNIVHHDGLSMIEKVLILLSYIYV